ncbi:hypothetical protein H072_10994 [Dactylellina haptotyla CBS 200.50]|uniref:F-box domain-containing protein n=1 Tax=Dactylellina haptotyla (strain CBS 200.50) TaxID=1284197 RepID=S7ZYS9_DACHA|nr:hypothetical protein H072_10994 [Dactylellina haptotyla CBS 200.50]
MQQHTIAAHPKAAASSCTLPVPKITIEEEEEDHIRGYTFPRHLPVEIHLQILSYLSYVDQLRCAAASSTWHAILTTYGQDPVIVKSDARYSQDAIRCHRLPFQNCCTFTINMVTRKINSIVFIPPSIFNPAGNSNDHWKVAISPETMYILKDRLFGINLWEPSLDKPTVRHNPNALTIRLSINGLSWAHKSISWSFATNMDLLDIPIGEFLELVSQLIATHSFIKLCKPVDITVTLQREPDQPTALAAKPFGSWWDVRILRMNGSSPLQVYRSLRKLG